MASAGPPGLRARVLTLPQIAYRDTHPETYLARAQGSRAQHEPPPEKPASAPKVTRAGAELRRW